MNKSLYLFKHCSIRSIDCTIQYGGCVPNKIHTPESGIELGTYIIKIFYYPHYLKMFDAWMNARDTVLVYA